MITWSDDPQRPDAGKGAMEIDWLDSGISAYVRAHLGHRALLGVRCANRIFRYWSLTVCGVT